jgi:tRNA-Thr(GGU) m(6)t(6)A37 methyltransferase TsaA
MGHKRELSVQPIGRVVTGRSEQDRDGAWQENAAEIEIVPAWAEALEGIEAFSHIWVIWWLDRREGSPPAPRVHPEGRPEMPLVGIFATRSPHRPSPIALTAVRLLARQGTRLRVEGLDAFVDTPIIDIKPYLRRGDLIAEATMPEWLERLWQLHDAGQ